MSLGQGARLAIQALYFTVIARSLGVQSYGAFVGAAALVGVFCPFASAGRGNILVQNVARDRSSFPRMWGAALLTSISCGMSLIGLVTVVSFYVLPTSIPTLLVISVAFSDMIGMTLITIAGQAFQSFEQMNIMAMLNVLVSAARLIAILFLSYCFHTPSPLQWGYAYLCSTACVSLAACLLVCIKLDWPLFALPHSWREIRQGLYFSFGLSAQTIYNDIDKTMLARLSSLSATGIYGAAYRIMDVSFAPVSALLYAAYPNFFRKGAKGVTSSLSYAKPLLIRSIAYAVAVAVAILLGAGLVPHVLGEQYRDTAEALRWLAVIPILKAIHYFLSDSLSGAGHQGLRSAIQVAVAIFNVLINLWLIPRYSWRGAAWSSIASDALLALSISVCAVSLKRLERIAALEQIEIHPA
jgi:O-antigen/teichoic acid export membrane protein